MWSAARANTLHSTEGPLATAIWTKAMYLGPYKEAESSDQVVGVLLCWGMLTSTQLWQGQHIVTC